MLLATAVKRSLDARTEVDSRDAAAAELAMLYARAIDAAPADPLVLARLGPKLFAALTALGLTLEARGPKQEGGKPSAQPAAEADPIDELERKRAERQAR